MRKLIGAMMAVAMTGAMVSADTVIDKQPDIGPWWNPLGNRTTYIYASDFIVPDGETTATQLGVWLEPLGNEPYAIISLELWGGDQLSGPDWDDVIATTDDFTATSAGLNLYVMDVVNQVRDLVPGEVCWLVANGWERGDPNYTSYRVGGHTQNSVYPDNGTFWYSNYPMDRRFDGQGRVPQMAFQVFLGGGGIELVLTGDCPGTTTATSSGNTPGGNVAFVYAFGEGNQRIPMGFPCAGTELGLNATAVLAGTVQADRSGVAVNSGRVPAGACGRTFVQTIDVASCGLSNVASL